MWLNIRIMTDLLTPEQRHKCMSHIRSKNTKPEIIVRKFLFSKGYRFRVNVKKLPGTPDIVLKKYKTVIFVNGCFWHGHEGCKYSHLPKSNVSYWEVKINKNKERDLQDRIKLRDMGWHVIQVWECFLKSKVREKSLERLLHTLNQITLLNYKTKPYLKIEEMYYGAVAEPDIEYRAKM